MGERREGNREVALKLSVCKCAVESFSSLHSHTLLSLIECSHSKVLTILKQQLPQAQRADKVEENNRLKSLRRVRTMRFLFK